MKYPLANLDDNYETAEKMRDICFNTSDSLRKPIKSNHISMKTFYSIELETLDALDDSFLPVGNLIYSDLQDKWDI